MNIVVDAENTIKEELPEHISRSEVRFERDSEYADLAIPCFTLGDQPPEVAGELSAHLNEKLATYDLVESVESVGEYVNVHFDWSYVGSNLPKILEQQEPNQSNGESVVIDYSSPNVAKPMHIGHLGTTIIGESLRRIYAQLGYETVGINYLGDWGTQFGKLGVAFERYGDLETVKERRIDELYELYVRFHEEVEENPELEDEARNWFQQLENGDETKTELWEMFRELSLQDFDTIYDTLGVEFDQISGESNFSEDAQKIVGEAREKGLAVESEGAIIIELEEYGLTNMIIQKSDGATNYAARDLAAMRYRLDTYDPEKNLYVVGNEQRHRFKQLFKSAELLGIDESDCSEHVNYGLMRLEDGQMSSREGRIIRAEDLIQESTDRVKRIIEDRNPDVEDKDEVALTVGVSAIKYSWLSHSRGNDIQFDWDEILSLEGDSGPYLQYTHSRCMSLLEKADRELEVTPVESPSETEQELIDYMIRFELQTREAMSRNDPSVVARQAYKLASKFNTYYGEHKIVGSDREEERLSVVSATVRTLRSYLDLLGIEATDEM